MRLYSFRYLLLLKGHRLREVVALLRNLHVVVKGLNEGRLKKYIQHWPRVGICYSNELTFCRAIRCFENCEGSNINESPLRAFRYRKAFQSKTENILSEDVALFVLIDLKLSKSQYQGLRLVSKENHCKLYPPYKKMAQAKNRCYPSRTAINITESSAEIPLSALLDQLSVFYSSKIT